MENCAASGNLDIISETEYLLRNDDKRNMDKPTLKYLIRIYCIGPLTRMASYTAYLGCPFIPESFLKLEKPIFIIGCSRSGTTIFNEIFSKHQDVANWSEAAQVFDLNYYSSDGDDLKLEKNASHFESYRLRLFFKLSMYARRRKRFMNKHPQNSMRIRYLNSIFPDAVFVHLIRDGRAVVFSNYMKTVKDKFRKRYPFGKFPKPELWRDYENLPLLMQFSHQWVDITRYIRNTANEILKPDRYIELRYEDFCREPHKILGELDAFCGLDIRRRDYRMVPGELKNYNFKWQDRLNEKDILEMEQIIGSCMTELGYR